MGDNALVSAVIPTRNRPQLVSRAVRSVLNQTYPNVEVVVVIDGPDQETVKTLEAMGDPRIRIVALTDNVGGSEARNTGVREAKGEWIAFLDDDDEWFPEKLEVQLSSEFSSQRPRVILASQYIDRRTSGDMIRPLNFPTPSQPISEYLFCDIGFFRPRLGSIQTSTLMAPRELLLEVPFTRGLKKFQDPDWLLRAVPAVNGNLHLVPGVLSIYHNADISTSRVVNRYDWRYVCDWAIRNRALFTPRALSIVLSHECFYMAMQQEPSFAVFWEIFGYCRKYGTINAKILWFFLRYSFGSTVIKPLLPKKMLGAIQKTIYR